MARQKLTIKLVKRVSGAKMVDEATREETAAATSSTAHAVESDVKQRAPVLSGKLRDSYKIRLFGTYAEVYSDLKVCGYAAWVEYGSSTAKAQPHLRPAGRAHRKSYLDLIRAATKRAAGKLP
jgi:HK97 gp10 family phage protein